MSKHTPGPWYWSNQYKTISGEFTWSLIGDGGYGILSCDGEENSPQGFNGEANARLIADAPAMELALRLISEGHARIERTGSLREFCFGGIRYLMNGDWNSLMDVIGWDKAIAKAMGEV